jgi:hypothetical protein
MSNILGVGLLESRRIALMRLARRSFGVVEGESGFFAALATLATPLPFLSTFSSLLMLVMLFAFARFECECERFGDPFPPPCVRLANGSIDPNGSLSFVMLVLVLVLILGDDVVVFAFVVFAALAAPVLKEETRCSTLPRLTFTVSSTALVVPSSGDDVCDGLELLPLLTKLDLYALPTLLFEFALPPNVDPPLGFGLELTLGPVASFLAAEPPLPVPPPPFAAVVVR